MLGMIALMIGLQPAGGDHNNLIPQMASSYLAPVIIGVFFLMVIGSLSSTADADLAALSSIVMTDIYGKHLSRGRVNPTTMLWVGRATMVVVTMLGIILASFKMDILGMLVFVGALWGSLVFPVIASFYWDRVTNTAFTSAVLVSLGFFIVARFELLPIRGVTAVVFEVCATLGVGVVFGLMAFGFFGRRTGIAVGVIAALAVLPFAVGFLRDYTVLTASLTSYGVSAAIRIAISLRNKEPFDFRLISQRVRVFEPEDDSDTATPVTQGAAV
jgi:Na+/proline symporter